MSAPSQAAGPRPNSVRKRVWFVTQLFRLALMVGARLQVFWRVEKIGYDNVPEAGAVIIAPNHRSWWDPILIFGGIRRNAAFLAKAGLFRKRPARTVLRWMGNIPVHRGTDAAVLASAAGIVVARSGGVVVVFPEGGAYQDGALHDPKGGMAYMALETGTTVVPVAIVGTERWHPFRRVVVVYGEAIAVSGANTPAARDALSALWHERTSTLIARAQQLLAPT